MNTPLLLLSCLLGISTQHNLHQDTDPFSLHLQQESRMSTNQLDLLGQEMMRTNPYDPYRRRLSNTLVWNDGNQALYKAGPEFQVNTYTNHSQQNPSIAALSNGGFVVAWHSDGQDNSSYGVYGQLYDNSGNKVGGAFQVNTYTNNSQEVPSVAALPAGGFVVAWASDGQDSSGYGVYGQLYRENGTKRGEEFQINTILH